MSKTDKVSISRNGVKKEVSKLQWGNMVNDKATYGWQLTSEIGKETIQKEGKVEDDRIKSLKTELTEANQKIKILESNKKESGSDVQSLEIIKNLTIGQTIPKLEESLKSIDSIEILELLLDSEKTSEEPRNGSIEAIESRIKELTPKK